MLLVVFVVWELWVCDVVVVDDCTTCCNLLLFELNFGELNGDWAIISAMSLLKLLKWLLMLSLLK